MHAQLSNREKEKNFHWGLQLILAREPKRSVCVSHLLTASLQQRVETFLSATCLKRFFSLRKKKLSWTFFISRLCFCFFPHLWDRKKNQGHIVKHHLIPSRVWYSQLGNGDNQLIFHRGVLVSSEYI